MHINKNIHGTILKFKNLNIIKKVLTTSIRNEKIKTINGLKLKNLSEIEN